MKKATAVLMFVLFAATTACIEDGAAVQQSTPDTTEPDAPQPDAPPAGDGGVDCPPDTTPPAKPTLTVTADPMTITSGESTTVSWTSTNTEKCWSTGGDQPTSGSWTDHPTETTTYSLTCKGLDGSTVDGSVKVTVTYHAPTINFTATPSTVTSGQNTTLSWSTTYADTCALSGGQFGGGASYAANWILTTMALTTTTNYWLVCQGPGGTVSSSATVTVTAPPPQCTCDEDCNDGYAWTGDACNTSTGKCTHWATDCGGMQVLPASNAATCQFWGGFGMSEPAPLLGTYAPSSLSAGPAGGLWKSAPLHACSVICYGPGADPAETTVDIQIEWSGVLDKLLHQVFTGLKKGTWDGKNLRY